MYVPADVTDPRLPARLVAAGLQPDRPAAFTVEGLVIYLTRQDAAGLLARLADLTPPGSRLGVSFESGFERQPVTRRFSRLYYRRSGEHWRFRLPSGDAPAFLSQAGWTIPSLLTGPDLETEHLRGTKLAGRLATSPAHVVGAEN